MNWLREMRSCLKFRDEIWSGEKRAGGYRFPRSGKKAADMQVPPVRKVCHMAAHRGKFGEK
jgi:hypothetical protein